MSFVDCAQQLDFLDRYYLRPGGFVADGGAKIKFVVGRPGSGKSRWLAELAARAREAGYLVTAVDARQSPVRAIDDLYRRLLEPIDVWSIGRRLAARVQRELGEDPAALGPEETFMERALRQGRVREIAQREARAAVERLVYRDPELERSFAFALTEMVADALGVRPLPAEERQILEHWLQGVPVPARERNRLHLRRAIDRSSARLMLRSWLRAVRLAGYRGHVLTVDNLDVVLQRSPTSTLPRFTRRQRDELYETLRELIDEMDILEGLLLVIAGDRGLFEDPQLGLRSYPALWMRIQNEVEAQDSRGRVNRFLDIVDLDALLRAEGQAALKDILLAQFAADRPRPGEREVEEAVASLWASRDATVSPVRRAVDWAAAWRGAAADA
jgi:hypothetical protein